MLGAIEPIEDVVARLGAVTADDVQRVAQRIIRSDNVSMSLVGPGADGEQLRELLAA
jgi:predicted Zn-dependent peptidase